MESERYSAAELADRVNQWCKRHYVEPLHNGAGLQVTVRNIRYYQTFGLVDRPLAADGHGFGEKHRLQLIAIRLLQAQGFPLAKIQRLLRGQTEEELRNLERDGVNQKAPSFEVSPVGNAQDWKIIPLTTDTLVLTRSGSELTLAQKLKIQEILSLGAPKTADSQGLGLESFRPETD